MGSVNCIFCGGAAIDKKSIVCKELSGKLIIINNAPVYYCEKCHEVVLYPREIYSVFSFIMENHLMEQSYTFDFNDIFEALTNSL